MSFQPESDLVRFDQGTEAVPAPASPEEAAVSVPAPETLAPVADAAPSRYAVAGRKGARRIHQLIQHGRLYEKEHGLKRGRQRIRQQAALQAVLLLVQPAVLDQLV